MSDYLDYEICIEEAPADLVFSPTGFYSNPSDQLSVTIEEMGSKKRKVFASNAAVSYKPNSATNALLDGTRQSAYVGRIDSKAKRIFVSAAKVHSMVAALPETFSEHFDPLENVALMETSLVNVRNKMHVSNRELTMAFAPSRRKKTLANAMNSRIDSSNANETDNKIMSDFNAISTDIKNINTSGEQEQLNDGSITDEPLNQNQENGIYPIANIEAMHADEIYSLSTLFSVDFLAKIRLMADKKCKNWTMEELQHFKDDNVYYEFVCDKLREILLQPSSETSALHLGLLILVDKLAKFSKLRACSFYDPSLNQNISTSSNNRQALLLSKNKMKKFFENVPFLLKEYILSTFTSHQEDANGNILYIITPQKTDKALAYMFVLYFHINQFSFKFEPIIASLKLARMKTMSILKGLGGTTSETTKIVKLTAPFKPQVMPKKSFKKK